MTNLKKNKFIKEKVKHNVGIIKSIKHTRWLFTLLGLWNLISDNATNTEKRLNNIIRIICLGLMIFVNIPIVHHSFYEKDYKIKIAFFGPNAVCVACVLKYFAVIYRQNEIKECLNELGKDWRRIESNIEWELMLKNIEKGNKVTVYFAIFMFGGGISHQAVAPFLPGTTLSMVRNSTDKSLVFPTTLYDEMFDTQLIWIYLIIYVNHILMGTIMCTMTAATCNLGAIFVTHLCGQIQIMIFRLDSLVILDTNKINDDNFHKQLTEIIKLHNKFIVLSQNIQTILNEVCFIEISSSTMIICIDEYYIMMAWKTNEMVGFTIYSTLLVAFISSIWILCYIGELLKEQCDKIGQSIYMVNWYLLPTKYARHFIIIIAMTQHPGKITAGGLIELSCNGFTSVLKTSIAYLNMLRMLEM